MKYWRVIKKWLLTYRIQAGAMAALLVIGLIGWQQAESRLAEPQLRVRSSNTWSLPNMGRQDPDAAIAALNLYPIWGPRVKKVVKKAAPAATEKKLDQITGIIAEGDKLYAVVTVGGIDIFRRGVGETLPDGSLVEEISPTSVTVSLNAEKRVYRFFEK